MDVATALARHTFEVAHRHDLLALGASSNAITRAVRSGEIVRVHRAVYLRGPAGGVEAIGAAARSLRGAASHISAALCHQLELPETPRDIHVTVARERGGLHRKGVTVHRADVATETLPWLNFHITTVLQTVLDCAVSLPLAHAVAIADSALRQGRVSLEELVHAARSAFGRNAGKIRRVAELADPKAASVLESLIRVLLVTNGLAPDASQLELRNARGRVVAVADFAYLGRRLLVEADGFEFHAGPRDHNRDTRKGNLYLAHGWDLLRFTWYDVVHDPDYVLATVRRELGRPARLRTA